MPKLDGRGAGCRLGSFTGDCLVAKALVSQMGGPEFRSLGLTLKKTKGWSWWHMAITLRRQRQVGGSLSSRLACVHSKFQGSLGYVERPCH